MARWPPGCLGYRKGQSEWRRAVAKQEKKNDVTARRKEEGPSTSLRKKKGVYVTIRTRSSEPACPSEMPVFANGEIVAVEEAAKIEAAMN